MNASEFVRKWKDTQLSERSACQQHFLDLCALVGHPPPAEVDRTGENFAFERGADKHGGGQGWADVWKRGFFGWEYKKPGGDLRRAYDQLLQYREALENPPLLVVSDMNRIEVRTNFTGTRTRVLTLTLADLDQPEKLEILRAVFFDPERLRPGQSVEAVTTEAARRIAEIAENLRKRLTRKAPHQEAALGFGEIARSLRATTDDAPLVARFLDRMVFCMFAEDIGLLPERLFTQLLAKRRTQPAKLVRALGQFFAAMRDGGDFGEHELRRFNGSLFDDVDVLDLDEAETELIFQAARLEWGAVDPSIFGTLFERGLDPSKRAQLGAHYTSRQDIETLVEPVVMVPLRREWEKARASAQAVLDKGDNRKERAKAAAAVADFLGHLGSVKVLDPACGSGNFLYVTLQKMKDLEKKAIVWATDRGLQPPFPMVHPRQFYGIEVNPYAYDLAQMTLWIGYLQWIRDNGFGLSAEPILESLAGNFLNMDAILDWSDPQNLREPEWPAVDFLVGNPPFLGGKVIRRELGNNYVDALHLLYGNRIPHFSDLCCYWFEKARAHIEVRKCKRAGLLATQGIRGGANRTVLKRIKETGDIFFCESDRPWILNGANVHVSMVGFDSGEEKEHVLDGKPVFCVNPNLTSTEDITLARGLKESTGLAFIGVQKSGPFDIDAAFCSSLLAMPGLRGKPTSDVLRPYMTALDVVRRSTNTWIIDMTGLSEGQAAFYEGPFEHLRRSVPAFRAVAHFGNCAFWQFWRPRPTMAKAISGLSRFLVTPHVAKHFIVSWLDSASIPSNLLIAVARDDDYFFGVLHSRFHEMWALKLGTRLETRPRYTPTTCFETFPFPWPPMQEPQDDPKVKAIAEGAAELDRLRRNWLNPPEWVKEEALEFPGSTDGPWARFVVDPNPQGIGTIRYPRLVPKDEGCAAQLKKRTLTNLYNQRPAWLDLAHRRLNETVAAAYGWPADLTDEQILKNLLALNLERSRQ